MYVRRFQLSGFRNYRSLDFEPPPGPLLFLGDNAQGKSNLLEAVALLATAKSARAGQDAEMIGWEVEEGLQAFARVHAQVARRGGAVDLETIVAGAMPAGPAHATLSQTPGRAGKRFRVNGIARRAVDFVGQLRAVLFTADDLEIVSGPPANRRAFLDTALSQADRGYYTALQRYGRILQQRNASLRRIKEGIGGLDELSLWDDGFSREGSAIVAARNRAVRHLGDMAAESHVRLSGSALELLELAYMPRLGEQPEGLSAEATTEEVQAGFDSAMASQRRREIAAGLSLVGPHRDDVAIVLNGAAASAFGSRAQIRTAALSMRLAEAELLRGGEGGDAPVLLLDDILSEMDEKRREAVLGGLAGFDQVWITATSGSVLPAAFVGEATVYGVESGTVVSGR